MLDTILNSLMKPTKLEKEQLKSLEFHDDMPLDVYDTRLSQKEKKRRLLVMSCLKIKVFM
ncbi:hypothetical protein [Lentilactobacillus kisonensis]|uniref:hypothetical protein n=1 Tax=Lentilactobacillus kisonensis TaxID=481722 RepID=UPI000A4A754E|nr:hypothetical protein [Lentilactobacillus kisonensis]